MEILVIRNNHAIINWERKSLVQRHMQEIELVASKITNNARAKKCFIFLMGTLFYAQEVMAKGNALEKISRVGKVFIDILMASGGYLIWGMCIVEILKTVMAGDTKSIAKTFMKYLLAYASLYMFPWFMDLVKTTFM